MTLVLIIVQLSVGLIQIALMFGLLRAAYSEINDIGKWYYLEAFTINWLLLIAFIFYIIVLRLVISKASKKFPKFYKEERKYIISTLCIILTSFAMRMLKFYLFDLDSFNDMINKSLTEFSWFLPMIILVFLCTTTLLQIFAVLL